MSDSLNIEKFFDGLAKALKIHFENKYPGLVITVKEIREVENANCNL